MSKTKLVNPVLTPGHASAAEVSDDVIQPPLEAEPPHKRWRINHKN